MYRSLTLLIPCFILLCVIGCQKGDVSTTSDTNANSSPSTIATNEPLSTEESLHEMMESQIVAMNKEDVDAYMASIDPASRAYAPTKEATKKLFELYDLKATLNSFELLSEKSGEAQVKTVITTVKISGPAFEDNKVTARHTVKKKDGKWVVVASEIENIEKP